MGDNLIGSLFNRAILDTLTGFLALVITNLLTVLVAGFNIFAWLVSSPYAEYTFWLVLSASFLFGHLVDKLAFLTLDHALFEKHFQNRLSAFDLPQWCQDTIEQRISNSVTVAPTKSRDLVDDSKTDWISAYFLTKARPEAMQKRTDLIANFQFVSNLVIILLYAFFVIPAYLYFNVAQPLYALVCGIAILIALIFYWRFSLQSLARIHTFENLVIYGTLIEEKYQDAKESLKLQTGNPDSRKGLLQNIFKLLFGE